MERDTRERASASKRTQLSLGEEMREERHLDTRAFSWGDPQAQRKAVGASPPSHGEGRHLGLSGSDSLTVENLKSEFSKQRSNH